MWLDLQNHLAIQPAKQARCGETRNEQTGEKAAGKNPAGEVDCGAMNRHQPAYQKAFLLEFTQWPAGRLEQIEKLEQLRALERGVLIKTALTNTDPVCVDTPEDVERVRRILSGTATD